MVVNAKSLEKLTKSGKSSWRGLIQRIEAEIDSRMLIQCGQTMDAKSHANCREVTEDITYYDPAFNWYSNIFDFEIKDNDLYLSGESHHGSIEGKTGQLEKEKVMAQRLRRAAKEIKKDYGDRGWKVKCKFTGYPSCEFIFKYK